MSRVSFSSATAVYRNLGATDPKTIQQKISELFSRLIIPGSRKEFLQTLEKVKSGELRLSDLPSRFLSNKEIVLAAFSRADPEGPSDIDYVDRSLCKDKEVILAATKQNPYALMHASQELLNDEEIIVAAVSKAGYLLMIRASEEMRKNKKAALAAVAQDAMVLTELSEELQKDRDLVLAAVGQCGRLFFSSIGMAFHNDREVALAAVKENGLLLEGVPEFKNDKEFVLAAVRQNGLALRFASEQMRDDREVVLAAILQDADALQCASPRLQADDELSKVALGRITAENAKTDPAMSIPLGMERFKSGKKGPIELFIAAQILKDGEVDAKDVETLISTLDQKKPEGILFQPSQESQLDGGTCSAMALTFAAWISAGGPVKRSEDLETALANLLQRTDRGSVFRSCRAMRNLQMALNAMEVSKESRTVYFDFAKKKAEALAKVYDFSIGNYSGYMNLKANHLDQLLKEEIDLLPQGMYLLRAVKEAKNEKMEIHGHSMILLKGEGFFAFYDPSIGLKIARAEDEKAFIWEALIFSLHRYALDSARLYQLVNVGSSRSS